MLRGIFAVAFSFWLCGAVNATTCVGKWGNGVSTSVKFLPHEQVFYCYGTQCWRSAVYTNSKGYMFRIGGGSISIEMIGSDKRYEASRKAGDDITKAVMTCR